MDLAHPFGIPASQVVVDGAEVHPAPGKAVQVCRQCRDEGLALSGAHLGDPSQVEGHAAHHLDVVVALPNDSPRRLTNHCEGLDQEVVEVLAVVEALPELAGPGT